MVDWIKHEPVTFNRAQNTSDNTPWPGVVRHQHKGPVKPTRKRRKRATHKAKIAHLNRQDWL